MTPPISSPPREHEPERLDESNGLDKAAKIAPTMQLSSRGLTISLLAMAACGLGVYAIFPASVGGPPLPVTVTIDQKPIESPGGAGAMLADFVVVENDTDHPIGKLTIDINGQYLYLQNSPLEPHEILRMPQRSFTDKRSSARFDPTRHDVEDIVVTGQLPSGARGVTKFEFQHD